VAVEGIAVQRLGVKHELAALWRSHRGCDRYLAAELVRGSRLALANAFDFGRRVQGIDLGAALAMVLMAQLDRQIEERGEARDEFRLAPDLAVMSRITAEPGAQEPERPAGTLELMGMAVVNGPRNLRGRRVRVNDGSGLRGMVIPLAST
jgi:hypothetical protein